MSSRFIDQFKTIPEMLERTARVYADREAYKWFEHRTNEWVGITWRQFSERVMRWRKAFAKMGLQRGARVAMLLPNSVDALTFDMAALCNALVPVPHGRQLQLHSQRQRRRISRHGQLRSLEFSCHGGR